MSTNDVKKQEAKRRYEQWKGRHSRALGILNRLWTALPALTMVLVPWYFAETGEVTYAHANTVILIWVAGTVWNMKVENE